MRAAVYVRYHSGDGFGHLGWAFDWSADLVSAGAVENHSGALETPAEKMGFWSSFTADPTPRMRELYYDDVKYVDVGQADPRSAYRVVQWIKTQPFRAIHRNCLDDVYDVLRAFGVRSMDAPSRDLIPKEWFARFHGTLAHIPDFHWHSNGSDAVNPRVIVSPSNDRVIVSPSNDPEPVEGPKPPETRDLPPLRPTWRRPWHPHFHVLNLRKLLVR